MYSQANKMAAVTRRRRRKRQNLVLLRRPRVFRDLNNLLESLEEEEVFQRYRFSPASKMFSSGFMAVILRIFLAE